MTEKVLNPSQHSVIVLAGWINHRQQNVIEYLREENRVLREQLPDRRLRFTDDQRRRLAVRAKGLGRTLLAEVARLVTPDTLMAWHRKLIAESTTATISAVQAGRARDSSAKISSSEWRKRTGSGATDESR